MSEEVKCKRRRPKTEGARTKEIKVRLSAEDFYRFTRLRGKKWKDKSDNLHNGHLF